VIAALQQALVQALAPWLGDPSGDANLWQSRLTALAQPDRQLMRWGAAFPMAPGLPTELMLCPKSQVAFCGDYLAGEGFGRVEGALRSGEALARKLTLQGVG
jgi:predicted NAD/FAD-dependent oxidoreductase